MIRRCDSGRKRNGGLFFGFSIYTRSLASYLLHLDCAGRNNKLHKKKMNKKGLPLVLIILALVGASAGGYIILSKKTGFPVKENVPFLQNKKYEETNPLHMSEAEFERFKEQQRIFTTEKLTSITHGYLLATQPENWSDPSISWSLRNNIEYVSVSYFYKIYIFSNLANIS